MLPFTVSMDSTVYIGKKCFISKNASLRGNVIIGDNCSVFDFASLRGDLGKISVGNSSNIQDNVSIHCDPGFDVEIGQKVSVGHNAVIHGSTINDSCIIGMGAILMNGSIIGSGSIVAAGTLILQNIEIPENSMVAGVPGTVKKVSKEYRIQAENNSRDYLTLKDEYLKGNIYQYNVK
jgi:carbonic anhydrase/acetyltransferase-like protein (isoleucine patch superfamily)